MSGTDKLTNKIEEVSGKGKQAVGDATGNRDLQAEGQKEETKGNLKQGVENIKDAFKS
ncbi:CsbD family protein [Blastococcus sp. TBT05-19]|uniref:CsbD family protein n=1 Tax=Blastococcus sp. TBT05-19 TaxID=2250581 RepID=UPI000DEA78E0|nr:CsbD family protein [Blastococcus sp. TBT05-19]RBY94372.1 CsbD family protein [Blastococcus sp. TBT05-19]